jgi:hypothetical protein
MATKTKHNAAAKPNKSAFVRSLAFDMPSADVIARAKVKGMRLTRNDVHAIRAIARRKREPKRQNRPTSANKRRTSASINKSAFVRSLASSLSAAEVIDRGKAKGIRLSAAQVYTIRANARRKGPSKVGAKAGAVGPGRKRAGASTARGRASGSKEAEFIATALDLGLARAEALIQTLRRKASDGW